MSKFDPFFKDVLNNLGPSFLEKAGWLDHGLNPGLEDYSHSNLYKITTSKEKPNLVLFNTGAYHPAHAGHIQIMEDSKEFLSKKGFNICAGFLCPSNRGYTDIKIKNKELTPASDSLRVFHLNSLLSKHSWLASDLWQLSQEREVNFTDTYQYFENLFKRHLNIENAEIAYVFGSDNAYFSYAFIKKGYCVCVLRPGHEDKFYEMKALFSKSNRHFFVQGTGTMMSSSSLGNKIEEPLSSKAGIYYIRDDSFLFENVYSKKSLIKFKDSFKAALADFVPECREIRLIDARAQRVLAESLFKNQKCINLDFLSNDLTEGTDSRNLSVCRVFSLNDSQIRPFKLDFRPEKRLSFSAAPGEYLIVDDDIATGYTLEQVKLTLLKNNIRAVGAISLLNKFSNNKEDFFDVIDLRDFMPSIDGKAQGLVVQNTNFELQRISYLNSKINLYSRASIPFKNHDSFRQTIFNFFKILKPLK